MKRKVAFAVSCEVPMAIAAVKLRAVPRDGYLSV
jgi:hypothetical protein